jgi:hypothetical protein
MTDAIRADKRVATPLVLVAVSDSESDKLRCAEILMRDKYAPAPETNSPRPAYRHDKDKAGLSLGRFPHASRPVSDGFGCVSNSTTGRRLKPSRCRMGSTTEAGDAFAAGTQLRSFHRRASKRAIREVARSHCRSGSRHSRRFDRADRKRAARAVLALRPPYSVNHLGYAGTFGGSQADYIIADVTVIPEENKPFYAEQVVYLPDSYMPQDSKRRIAEYPPGRARRQALPERAYRVASFNNAYKFNAPTFAIWMRLLKRRLPKACCGCRRPTPPR